MNESTLSKKTCTQQLQPQGKVDKKPYLSPRLMEYGNLVELTLGGGSKSFDAGGSKRAA